MKTLRSVFLVLGSAALISSCGVPPPGPRPHVAVTPSGVSVGVYDTLPAGYAGPYFFYGNRYYYGGRWETGRFTYHGRHYTGRYFHNGHFFYGGRFHAGGPGHPHR